MKIQKIFWALMVMALPLGMIGCSSKDEDGDVDDTPYTYQTPAQKQDAAKFETTAPNAKIRSVVFGEGGNCIIAQPKSNIGGQTKADLNTFAVTRAEEELIYIIGTYVKTGATYAITVGGKPWGTIAVTKEAETVTLIVQETGQTQPEIVTVTEVTKMADNNMTDLLCRTWKPFRTRLKFKKLTSETWLSDELPGADFEKVKVRINRESTNPDDPIIKDGFGEGYDVTSVFFTQTGTFCIAFSNGKSYVGEWHWDGDPSKGDIRYEWIEEGMGCEYETGVAHVDIYTTDVYKGECWLRLKNDDIKLSSGEKWQVELVFRLNP